MLMENTNYEETVHKFQDLILRAQNFNKYNTNIKHFKMIL